MAIYRQIHISFWQDPFVLELKPEEKYFYLYLMTNSKTSQCGMYEITKKVMLLETGFSEKKLNALLKKFISFEKIDYDEGSGVLFIRNWLKYNFSNSPKVKSRIETERKAIKSPEFKRKLDTVLIQYGYSMDTQTQSEVKVKVKEEEKPEVKVKEEPAAALQFTPLPSTFLPESKTPSFTNNGYESYKPETYKDYNHIRNRIEKVILELCKLQPDKSEITRFFNIVMFTKEVKPAEAFYFFYKICKEFHSFEQKQQNFKYLSRTLEGRIKDALDAAKKKADSQKPLNGNGLEVIQEAANKLSIQ